MKFCKLGNKKKIKCNLQNSITQNLMYIEKSSYIRNSYPLASEIFVK